MYIVSNHIAFVPQIHIGFLYLILSTIIFAGILIKGTLSRQWWTEVIPEWPVM